MTSGIGPYEVPFATDDDPTTPALLETTIVARHAMVDIGGEDALQRPSGPPRMML